jgi:drug/metabolite transporter (DMT)-like permease
MPEDQRVKNLKSIPLIVFAVTMMVTGQILEKKGIGVVKAAAGEDFTFFSNIFAIIFNTYVLVGIMVYFVSALVWLMILSKADLSFAYPFLAISYVAIIIVSPIALPGEPSPDFWKALAVLLIIAGVMAMAQGERVRERKKKDN